MEAKKGGAGLIQNSTPIGNETDSIPKHQHNTAPQHVRLLQYGLKIPNNQHQHQLKSPNVHQHMHQSYQASTYRHHLSPSTTSSASTPQQYKSPTIHTNPMHQHLQENQQYLLYEQQRAKQIVNQPIYQSNQAPHLHPHNPLNQHNPQIWTPHQPPQHYHQQVQSNQQQRFIKDAVGDKKKSATNTHLRSPSAKRPLDAPVTLQGWLHKQGSEGLMLWKKRWFVLSQYCLFYYKGPEEEKLLGSILLPSYKVSICCPDDKVNKKYAFKCEHTNMRTYILAADSQELMMQWIRLLNLACLLQSNMGESSDQSATITNASSSSYNQSNSQSNIDHSESGFTQQYVTHARQRHTPVHMHSSSNTTDLSNPSQELNQYNQPLYANAPPKPRRLNDAGYSSPSPPDAADRFCNEPKYVILQQPPQPQYTTPSTVIVSKSPSLYGMYGNPEYTQIRHDYNNIVQNNAERRTPDTYGRSKTHSSKGRRPSDYEDIYTEQYMYKRPLSPLAYNNIKKITPAVTPIQRPFTPVSMLGPTRKSTSSIIPRPHSADFLEYEITHRQNQSHAVNRQPSRPKSSLDINRNYSNDNYFYTEERYAEKMRNSAQYLSKIPKFSQGRSSDLEREREFENSFPLMRSNTQPISNNPHLEYNNRGKEAPQQPSRSRSVLSEGSLSKELDADFRGTYTHHRYDPEAFSPDALHASAARYNYSEDEVLRMRDYDPFTRSASARLAHIEQRLHGQADGRAIMNREGERKREESMKRLLEWKQRMLQSPLNRKLNTNSSMNKGYPSKQDMYYKSPENGYVTQHKLPQHNDIYTSMELRSPAIPFPQYNSYSSDDEENVDRSKEQMQAGRTLDTLPTETALYTSIPVINSQTGQTPHQMQVANSALKTTTEPTPKDSNAFTKPLKLFNKEASHLAHVSSLRSEYMDKFEETPTITEIKSNGALVKSILAEFERKPEHQTSPQPTNVTYVDTIIEENYMTMTPKKSILDPHPLFELLEPDENPYVEMTQGINTSLLDPNNMHPNMPEHQPYEMICFADGQIEPLYMELHQPKAIKVLDKQLPDILMPSKNQSTKSDSSDDADDEASKDLESLEALRHPRFSLSDTFRPASYYLGASQTVPELQDSSDSELVSPPPIPRSPPPLEELENEAKEQNRRWYSNRNSDQYFNSNNKANKLDAKKHSFRSTISFKDQDSLSICSVNTDAERRSQTSDSDSVELRTHLTRTADYERMLKRRPVSDEFRDELESLDSDFNKTIDSVELDKYLKDLQVSTPMVHHDSSTDDILRNLMNSTKIVQANDNNYHDYENLCIMTQNDKLDTSILSNISALSPISIHKHSRDNSRDTQISQNTVSTFQSDSIDGRSLLSSDFIQRARVDSSNASVSVEMSSFLHQSSSRSTPSICLNTSLLHAEEIQVPIYFGDISTDRTMNVSFSQPAPYYYSDLSMNTSNTEDSSILTLNNQRGTSNGKRDITHIVNPIRCNSRLRNTHSPRQNIIDDNFKLAAEARSVSVDFLNLTDKSGQIDKKNIYESDTLKRLKVMDSATSLQSNPEMRNLYPRNNNGKFNAGDDSALVRRSHSLEGLLENVLCETNEIIMQETSANVVNTTSECMEGSYLWEEDSVWRERLRTASQRHTKSLDDLDSLGEPKKVQKKPSRGIIRGVTYVNDNIYNMPLQDKQQKYLQQADNNKNVKSKDSFTIDREKLRQWDLMSSAPSDSKTQMSLQCGNGASISSRNNTEIDVDDRVRTADPDTQEAASVSVSLNTRDTFPRTLSSKRAWASHSQHMQSKSSANIYHDHGSDYSISSRQGCYMSQDLSAEKNRKVNWNEKMNVSAGDLLGRTHEELVLLLIQLRRQSTNTCHAIEACYNEIDNIQAQLHVLDAAKRLENFQKLEQIKQHLLELEKQYEKGKPLVNLVDNMVKLGSLYRTPSDRNNYNPYVRDRLEINQQMQERRLLAEEKRDWSRLNPNHSQLQEKVQQLYQLDQLIQEESGTLQGLQQDKEDIERALGGLRHRLMQGLNDPVKMEQARKQQAILENELSRVHLMLAQNSKKLEETVAGNARLESELLMLKQKLQISRQNRSSPQFSNAGDSLPCVVGTSAMLESDLQKVQQKVGDLTRQRQELSMQVRQLTDRSTNFQLHSITNSPSNSQALLGKKRIHALWRETDLDTMDAIDHGDLWENRSRSPSVTPLYINTDLKQNSDSEFYSRSLQSDSTSDDNNQHLIPAEKQEIKTVRIVKRESERRQRESREKVVTGKWDPLLEEENSSQGSGSLYGVNMHQTPQSAANKVHEVAYCADDLSRTISSPNLPAQPQYDAHVLASGAEEALGKSPELSPVFKSEAARQIITEMQEQPIGHNQQAKQSNRRAVPKEKRRHYTAPHNNLIMKSLNHLANDENAFDKMIMNSRRARDDLDMERALRQRVDAPDLVRSTLNSKELKYNECTIDNLLGTPNKINIPERYIPEQLPQLSAEEQEHRLRKVESIKKMLSDTTIISSSSVNTSAVSVLDENSENTASIANKVTANMVEEKKQREHLLQLNQILAKQVMEMSKIVAVKALQRLPLHSQQLAAEDDDLSPETPLPLYQQRDNFYS